jgi:hypothetical protein
MVNLLSNASYFSSFYPYICNDHAISFKADSRVEVDDFVSNDADSHDFRRVRAQKKERLINSLQKTNRPLLSTH